MYICNIDRARRFLKCSSVNMRWLFFEEPGISRILCLTGTSIFGITVLNTKSDNLTPNMLPLWSRVQLVIRGRNKRGPSGRRPTVLAEAHGFVPRPVEVDENCDGKLEAFEPRNGS